MPGPIIAAGLSFGAGLVANHMMQKKQAEMNKESMALQNAYSRQNLRDSPALTLEGLRHAGVSPATMNGGNFQTASSPTPAMPSAPAVPSLDLLSALQAQSNIKLQNAEAEKTKAEATSTNIDNQNKQSQNTEIKDALNDSVQRVLDFYKKTGVDTSSLQNFKDYLDSPDSPFDYGSMKARLDALNYEKLLSSNISGDVSDVLDTLISNGKIDADVADDIAHMTHSQRKLLDKQVSLAVKQIAFLDAQTKESGSKTKVNEKQLENMREERVKLMREQDYIEQETKRSKQSTLQMKNSDFKTMYASGDYLGVVRTLGLDGWSALLDALKLIPFLRK